MKHLIFLMMVFACLNANATHKYEQDIQLLEQALTQVHPGYERYIDSSALDNAWLRLRSNTENASELVFYSAVSRLLAELKCQHTKAELPKILKQQKTDRFMPLTFKLFDGQMFVDKSTLGLPRGTRVISINGKTIPKILSTLRPLVARDGFTDHTLDVKIERDSDLFGSNFEQFFAPAVLGLASYPTDFTIQVQKPGQKEHEVINATSISFKQWVAMSGRPYRLDFKDSVSIAYRDNTAVLTVDTFVNYRQPVDAFALFEGIFKTLEERQVRHLIVDLRNNGGGSDDAQNALLKHLYDKPFKVNSAAYVKTDKLSRWQEQLKTWDTSLFTADISALPKSELGFSLPAKLMGDNYRFQQPAKHHFKGKITMLSSLRNASASGALLAHIQQQENVTLLGDETGGNQGGTTASQIAFLKLPISGITVRVPLIRNQYNLTHPQDGYGATPDIPVSITKDDWFNGVDTQMQAALKLH